MCSPKRASCFCRSRNLACWIWQAFAYLSLVLLPLTQPGLLDIAGVCIPVPRTFADHAAWPIGYRRCLHTCASYFCRSRSLAYWIEQGFACLSLVFLPITQPGLLDVAGVCIPVPHACANHAAWLIGYSGCLHTCPSFFCRSRSLDYWT